MTELLIIVALILLNGLFALSELAVVSARHSRLKAQAGSGRKGADRALALAADPGRFLSAVQIGITLIGIINGAYSGETFGVYAANAFKSAGVPETVAGPLGYGIVIVVILEAKSDTIGAEPHATERQDGSWLLSGAMPVDEMADRIGIPLPKQRGYETVAGFVLAHLQRIPKTGDHLEVRGWRFEVVDLDGRRIDKVLASRIKPGRRLAA